jgi:chemotaxis signal transduction protein
MTASSDLHARVAMLKRRFDEAFAEPPPPSTANDLENLLAVELAGVRYYLRLREIEGLYQGRAIAAVPSRSPYLLGVADFRGELVAVFDLSALLGGAPATHPRYLVRSAQRDVGFAFERFEGHVRVSRQAQALAGGSAEGAHAAHVLQSIIDLPSLVARLERDLANANAREA